MSPAKPAAPRKSIKAEHVSIASQLYRHLRDEIVRGALKPGQALSEAEISQTYQTSRQPVREAFIKLAEDGLVTIQPSRGTFVSKISISSILEARFVREAIEVAIVRELARTASQDTLNALRALLAQQQTAANANDVDGFLRLDEEFHQAILVAVGNTYAWKIIRNIKSQMSRVRLLCSTDIGPSLQLFIDQHAALVEAISQHDADAAARHISAHLQEIITALPGFAQQHPELFHDEDDV